MENIGIALQLMVVGMITVFIILIIVIQLGKLLIWTVNKIAPEEVVAPKGKPTSTVTKIDAQTLSIIQAASTKLTNGKGSIKNIERI